MSRIVAVFGALVAAVVFGAASGQQPSQSNAPNARLAAYQRHVALEQSSPYQRVTWSFVGPTNMSGRVNAIAVADRGSRRRIYVGCSGSGLWASDDAGATFQEVWTRGPATAIYAIAVAPSNPDVVWVLTGSTRSHVPLATAGAFKSVDAGRTWVPMGLSDIGENGYGSIFIHPSNPSVVYVATTGGTQRTDARGLFKTSDGGRTWARVFGGDTDSGPSNLVMDPNDPNRLYLVTRFRPRGSEPVLTKVLAEGSRPSLYASSDAGATWVEIAMGLPDRKYRGPIDVGIASSGRLYAVLTNQQTTTSAAGRTGAPAQAIGAELYESDDRGAHWRRVGPDAPHAIDRANLHIWVDPFDQTHVYLGGPELRISRDSGKSFVLAPGPGVFWDHNALWLDPKQAGLAYSGSDVGFFTLRHDGAAWLFSPMPTAQMYALTLDMATPFHAYASVQDEDFAMRGVVRIDATRRLTSPQAFELTAGNEVSTHVVDPSDSDTLYASGMMAAAYNGSAVGRYNFRSGVETRKEIAPTVGAGDPPLRGAWLLPIVLSPHDPHTLYVGYQYLFRSRDRGDHWDRISGDLSDGGPFDRAFPDYENMAIDTISESPLKRGLIYAGTDDGHLHVTIDDGQTWTELSDRLPSKLWIGGVQTSRYAEGTVYVVQRGRDRGDFGAHVYRSSDFGTTFTSVAANLPDAPVNVIREDPKNPNVLYIGTDLGVYVSSNGGARWDVVGSNLPTVPVTDLQIHPRDRVLVITTFGRGMWAIDAMAVEAKR
jgi:photosystem II stability/assembly factor-like uncharacterized protein